MVSRYGLEDMVVVQVCLKLTRMISASNLAGPPVVFAAGARLLVAAVIAAPFRRSRRFTLFDPSRRHEKLGPMLVAEVADLYHWMVVRGGVDELAVADVHACVGNPFRRRSEVQEISGFQLALFNRLYALPVRLR